MNKTPTFRMSILAASIATMLLSACATDPVLPPALDVPTRAKPADAKDGGTQAGSTLSAPRATSTVVDANPTPPTVAPKFQQPAQPVVASGGAADVILNFDQLALPAFIQTVYATVLKKNVSIDPAVMARKDLVTLRSGRAITAEQAESSVRTLLKSYGIAVQDISGLVRVVPDTTNLGYLPEIRRGRALPDTPLPLRPVFQMVELQVVRNTDVAGYLRTLFGDKVKYTEDPGRNSLLLSGNGDDVQAAIEAIQVLDQPLFKGRNSIRISPTIWSADELTKRLTEILTQEGYAVGTTNSSGGIQYPITLLPVSGVNSVIVFANSKDVINHIVEWAKVLDKPQERSVGRSFFSYQVRNTDASRLAETVQKLLSSTPARPAGGAPTAAGTTGAAAAPAPTNNSVVVDKATNTILFRASGEEYTDIIRLLNDLDRSARQVLIEVTIAEVTLTDGIATGVSWLSNRANQYGRNVTQFGGPDRSPSNTDPSASNFTGLLINQFADSMRIRAELRAEATDGRVTFLSNPKSLTRNGETAKIQVGDSVPILTQSLGSAGSSGGSNTNVISSVQYVDTGTIMTIKPVIHSSDQVDMDITVESSLPGEIASSGPQSPAINKRLLDTKLTLQHGSTYVLGGLISTSNSRSGRGVPFLKDIPLLGRAFKTDTVNNRRAELIIMITPYIMSNDSEARAVTDAVKKQLGGWATDAQVVAPIREAPPSTLPAPKQ
jgi:general secretion pathway protein D